MKLVLQTLLCLGLALRVAANNATDADDEPDDLGFDFAVHKVVVVVISTLQCAWLFHGLPPLPS